MPAHKKQPLPAVGPSQDCLKAVGKGVRNIAGAAEFIGGSETAVWDLIHDGVVRSFKRGRHRVIPVRDLQRYLAGLMEDQLEEGV